MIMERKNFVVGVNRYIADRNAKLKKGQPYSLKTREKDGVVTFNIYKGRRISKKFTINTLSAFRGVTGPKAARRMGYVVAAEA